MSLDDLFTKAKELFQFMVSREQKAATRREVVTFLGDQFSDYYVLLAKALEHAGKARLKRGPGGIEFPARQGAQMALVAANEVLIRQFLENNYIPESDRTQPSGDEGEAVLYGPLQSYLENADLYDHVVVHGDARSGGGPWKNPDVLCLSYTSDIKFSIGVLPQITAIEVKFAPPNIRELQQARSYLTFAHSAYLCFYDPSYTGKDYDYLVSTLRDAEIWDNARDFELGLIVAYRPTVRSDFYFQTIREAPASVLAPRIVDAALDRYFEESIRKSVSSALRSQIFRAMQQ